MPKYPNLINLNGSMINFKNLPPPQPRLNRIEPMLLKILTNTFAICVIAYIPPLAKGAANQLNE